MLANTVQTLRFVNGSSTLLNDSPYLHSPGSLAFVIFPSIFVHQHERERAGVSDSKRQKARIGVGVSAKIDRRMRKTGSFSQITALLILSA